MPGRRETAQKASRNTCEKRKEQETRVDARAQRGGRGARGKERDESSHGNGSHCDSEQSPSERDQQALGKKLPCQSPARSAEGQPCANLTITGRSTCQEQTGDIQASETQQHCGYSE